MENINQEDQDLANKDAEAGAESSQEAVATDNQTDGEAQLKKLQDDLAESRDKYLRLYAEFDNHRRRTAKEKIEMIQSASLELVRMLLPVLDDFERAEKSFSDRGSREAEGFFLIQNKFRKVLEQNGLTVMPVSRGSSFDADLQEAITQIPAPDDSLRGKVVDVIEKGYLLNDKVIRFAKVVVGQ